MKHFLFGMDQKMAGACAHMLHERHIEAVVAGNFLPEAAAALQAEGIEMYLSFGAYGISPQSTALAQDAFGQPRGWFRSGCPNDEENAQRHMDVVLAKASALPGLRGILVDGARFASFASEEGAESFFTCFCPRCMQKMEQMGLNAQSIRSAVGRLMTNRRLQPEEGVFIRQWLAFREHTVMAYMDRFAQQVHALPGRLLAGAFIFAPSLARFVGQTAQACRSLDVISPMLYRAYPHEYGVACLGHEWAAFRQCFAQETSSFIHAAADTFPFCIGQTPDELLRNGFSPEHVGLEVAQSRKEILSHQQLWPILQIEDERIAETIRQAFSNGADAAGLFSYGQAEVPQL